MQECWRISRVLASRPTWRCDAERCCHASISEALFRAGHDGLASVYHLCVAQLLPMHRLE